MYHRVCLTVPNWTKNQTQGQWRDIHEHNSLSKDHRVKNKCQHIDAVVEKLHRVTHFFHDSVDILLFLVIQSNLLCDCPIVNVKTLHHCIFLLLCWCFVIGQCVSWNITFKYSPKFIVTIFHRTICHFCIYSFLVTIILPVMILCIISCKEYAGQQNAEHSLSG